MTSPRPGTAIVSLTVNSNGIFDQDNPGLQLLENSGRCQSGPRIGSGVVGRGTLFKGELKKALTYCLLDGPLEAGPNEVF